MVACWHLARAISSIYIHKFGHWPTALRQKSDRSNTKSGSCLVEKLMKLTDGVEEKMAKQSPNPSKLGKQRRSFTKIC